MELNPDYPWYYHKLGTAFMQLEKSEKAVKIYHRAIELKPDLYLAHKNLGDALMQLLKWLEAVKADRRAIEIEPNYRCGLL